MTAAGPVVKLLTFLKGSSTCRLRANCYFCTESWCRLWQATICSSPENNHTKQATPPPPPPPNWLWSNQTLILLFGIGKIGEAIWERVPSWLLFFFLPGVAGSSWAAELLWCSGYSLRWNEENPKFTQFWHVLDDQSWLLSTIYLSGLMCSWKGEDYAPWCYCFTHFVGMFSF